MKSTQKIKRYIQKEINYNLKYSRQKKSKSWQKIYPHHFLVKLIESNMQNLCDLTEFELKDCEDAKIDLIKKIEKI